MRICKAHYEMMKEAITNAGMWGLVMKDETEAAENFAKMAMGQEDAKFDPLQEMNNHFWSEGLRCGGLYLMGTPEDATVNEGHYCPVCEFEKHQEGFVAKDMIETIAGQMRQYAIAQGLLTKPS